MNQIPLILAFAACCAGSEKLVCLHFETDAFNHSATSPNATLRNRFFTECLHTGDACHSLAVRAPLEKPSAAQETPHVPHVGEEERRELKYTLARPYLWTSFLSSRAHRLISAIVTPNRSAIFSQLTFF